MDLQTGTGIIVSLAVAAAFSVIVLHSRIREGLLIKIGLVLCIVSLLTLAAAALGQGGVATADRADMSLRGGLAVVCMGLLVRARRLRHLRREASARESRPAPLEVQRTRGFLHALGEPVRDLAEMFGSDWAELDALETRRERLKLARKAHRQDMDMVQFSDSRSWETRRWATRPMEDSKP